MKPRYIEMISRYEGKCAACDIKIFVDERIVWDTEANVIYCERCGEELLEQPGLPLSS